jgi:hypothetical protein
MNQTFSGIPCNKATCIGLSVSGFPSIRANLLVTILMTFTPTSVGTKRKHPLSSNVILCLSKTENCRNSYKYHKYMRIDSHKGL